MVLFDSPWTWTVWIYSAKHLFLCYTEEKSHTSLEWHEGNDDRNVFWGTLEVTHAMQQSAQNDPRPNLPNVNDNGSAFVLWCYNGRNNNQAKPLRAHFTAYIYSSWLPTSVCRLMNHLQVFWDYWKWFERLCLLAFKLVSAWLPLQLSKQNWKTFRWHNLVYQKKHYQNNYTNNITVFLVRFTMKLYWIKRFPFD